MRREKALFWLIVAVLAVVSAYFLARSTALSSGIITVARGQAARAVATPITVLTALPTIFAADRLDLAWPGEGCGQETIYTSLPAKCLTAQGLREAAPRVNERMIQITAIPVP